MKNGNEIQIADYEVATEPEINLRDYWDRIWRRRTTVLIVTLGVFILGAFWTFIQKPVYTAKSQLLVEKEPNILSFDQVLQIEAMRDDFYQTQYKLLSGRGLADTVIERLKLYDNPEFARPKSAKKPVDPTDHVFREDLIDAFSKRLSVRPVRKTRLVQASFNDHNVDNQFDYDLYNGRVPPGQEKHGVSGPELMELMRQQALRTPWPCYGRRVLPPSRDPRSRST